MNKQQLKIKQINEQQKLKRIEQEKQNEKKEKNVKKKKKINYKKYCLFFMFFAFVFIGFYYNDEIDNAIKKHLNLDVDIQKHLMGNATGNMGSGFGMKKMDYGSFIDKSEAEIETIEDDEKVCVVSKKENSQIKMNCINKKQ